MIRARMNCTRAMAGLAFALALALPATEARAWHLPRWLDFSSHAQDSPPLRPIVSEIIEDRGAALRWVPGVVTSRNQVNMAFQSLGRIVRRPVDLGDRVRAGDVLAELATEDLAAQTRAARAAVDAAQVQAQTAQATLERTQALAARSVVAAAQLEQAERAATAAAAAVEQARSELVRAEDAEGFATMTAPFDGVISAVFEAPGTVVTAGQPVLQLSAEDQREAVIDVPESALAGLEPDSTFTVWQCLDPGHEISAVLDRIDPLADSATRTRRLYLELPLDAPFRLGALIRARFGHADAPALSVPEIALFQRDGHPHLWRVVRPEGEGGGHVEAVPVETGAVLQGRVMITGGVSAGDEVVVRGVNALSDWQAVGRRVDP